MVTNRAQAREGGEDTKARQSIFFSDEEAPMSNEKPTFDVFLLVQSLIAIILVIVLCVMLLAGMSIPDLLVGLTGLVVGQYFGARQSASAVRQQASALAAYSQAVDGR